MQYAPNYFLLRELQLPPLARELFGLLVNLSNKTGEAYISRKYLAEKLNSHINSISRSLKILIDNNLLQKTGEYFNILFPRVSLTPKAIDITRSLPTPNQMVTPPTPSSYTNKNTDNNINKQQQDQIVDDDLFNKLISFGVGKSASKSWINNRPIEIIKKQIEHLEILLAKSVVIHNKPGWLNKAIKDNYDLPICEAEPKKEVEEAFLEEQKLTEENLKKQRILELKQIIPQEEQDRILNEELEKQKGYLHKLGLFKLSALHKMAAEMEMEKRLLATGFLIS